MIVRDEAELLPRFLDAARGVWDELCVVDTGSRDGTVALLEGAGAHVGHRPWDDDFAAARNASLAMATGQWILILDADEMLSPELREQIRQVVGDDTAGAATVVMRNPLPGGHTRQARLLRLFRAHPGIRYEFPIHEDLSRSLMQHLASRPLVHLPGAVEHLGYVRQRAAARDKQARDTRILQGCVDRDPTDFYGWFKLLEIGRFWQDRSLLASAAAAAEKALRAAPSDVLEASHFGGELIVLVADGLYPADARQALAVLDSWAERLPPSAAFHMRRGELCEAQADPTGAARAYTKCLDLAAVTPDVQFATVRPLLGLARLAMTRGDFVQAWAHTQDALAHSPRDREALTGALFISRLARGADGIADFVSAYVSAFGDSPEMRAAVAELQRQGTPAGPS